MNIWRFPYYINKPSLVQIGLQLFKWSHLHIFSLSHNLTSDDLWPWYMTFNCMNIWRFTYNPSLVQIRLEPSLTFDRMNIWRFPYYINKPSLVQIGLQLFKWGNFHIFSLSYNLTSDDLWPWYMTFDLINKWGFPCCIYMYDMWKIEPHVNTFSQQTTPTTTTNNRGQSDPYMCLSCLGRHHNKK